MWTKKELKSEKYKKVMMLDRDVSTDGRNSAHKHTKNFNQRMFVEHRLGAWRHWASYKNRDLILEYTHNPKLKGIDFGGAKGPISPYADIIDIANKAKFGLKIKSPTLDIYTDNSIDYIWSSHALEHVDNLVEVLQKMYDILKPNGTILFLLPAYTCRRWIPSNFNSHKCIFCLSGDYSNGINIEFLLKRIGFSLKECYYCADNSIFIHGNKQ